MDATINNYPNWRLHLRGILLCVNLNMIFQRCIKEFAVWARRKATPASLCSTAVLSVCSSTVAGGAIVLGSTKIIIIIIIHHFTHLTTNKTTLSYQAHSFICLVRRACCGEITFLWAIICFHNLQKGFYSVRLAICRLSALGSAGSRQIMLVSWVIEGTNEHWTLDRRLMFRQCV